MDSLSIALRSSQAAKTNKKSARVQKASLIHDRLHDSVKVATTKELLPALSVQANKLE